MTPEILDGGDAARTTFLDPDTLPFPFCPGCGHGTILEKLDAALVRKGCDPRSLVIVTDIGCAGLSDRHFVTNAFHGLHGRSVTYATGLKLANPELEVVVLMGDGGCGIGGHHLINAARRNIGVTVIVFNNLNYGMTGGEHSVSTPPGAITATTPLGQIERPMDICATVGVNGASFVARSSTFEPDLVDVFVRALENPGFSLVDTWELCTAYFASANRLNKKALQETQELLGMPPGVLYDDPREEYAAASQEAARGKGGEPRGGRPITASHAHALEAPLRVLLAGAAGKKTVSAAGALAGAAIRSGLFVSQRDDYPVTVKTGHVLSELVLSPEEILYAGVPAPDVALVLFPEGLAKASGALSAMGPAGRIYLESSLPEVETRAEVIPMDLHALPGWERRKEFWAMIGLGRMLADLAPFPPEALLDAIGTEGELAERRREAVQLGVESAGAT
jgi:pyruvate/2-oxoacid:ferredoxin oxidoreductase beta subunit/Pyruvate/2-oxoacid:ferredoxin oxidoreductase gamma subunit